jgi:hypothetical protein
MAKPTKAQLAEHEKAIERAALAAETSGFVGIAHPNLGFARVRVTHGTTIVVGGATESGDTHWESHADGKEGIDTEAPYEGDSEVVLPMAMAMQYEALGQVEILERIAPAGETEKEGSE